MDPVRGYVIADGRHNDVMMCDNESPYHHHPDDDSVWSPESEY